MKVLVTGSGGREHALAWKAAASSKVEKVFVAPGNAGTATEPSVENVPLDVMDFEGLVSFAKAQGIDLTIVGPEAPLVAGMVDAFAAAGLKCFGPSAKAAQLEGSKSYTKAFLDKYQIPTAAWQAFESPAAALDYLATVSYPVVIKADGLAAGKGVVIAQNRDEAETTVKDMLGGNILGGAGSTIVIEEFLEGEEASFIVIADGARALPFASSQDHKPIGDGDTGPNTGGMGAYSPAPVVTPELHQRIMDEVINPTIKGMAEEGAPYTGFLYAGLMIDSLGAPKVIEFNCRFGDPEAQPVLSRMTSDLPDICLAAIDGNLDKSSLAFDKRSALTVVVASGGYPGDYETGKVIKGLAEAAALPDVKVFHAGTRSADDGADESAGGGRGDERVDESTSGGVDADGKGDGSADVLTAGGRVLGITALAKGVTEAQRLAYEAIDRISFEDMYCRTDIGYRALLREEKARE